MKTSIIITLGALASSAFAQLKSQVNYLDTGNNPFDSRFWSATSSPPTTVSQWTNGLVPSSCLRYTTERGCGGSMTVTNVTYSDCAEPWVFCRCQDSQMTLNAMIDLFGRLPVHLRSTVRYIYGAGSSDGKCSGLSSPQGDLLALGSCYAPTFWVHEAAHQLDWRGIPNQSGEWSDKPFFGAALANDTCATDDYGNSHIAEEFAQISVMVAWLRLGNTPLPTQQHPGCLDWQIKAVNDTFGESHLTYGGTCINSRTAHDAFVTNTRLRRRSIKRTPEPTTTRIDSFNWNWVPPEYTNEAKF